MGAAWVAGSGFQPHPTKEALCLELPTGWFNGLMWTSLKSCSVWVQAESYPVPGGLVYFQCLYIYNLWGMPCIPPQWGLSVGITTVFCLWVGFRDIVTFSTHFFIILGWNIQDCPTNQEWDEVLYSVPFCLLLSLFSSNYWRGRSRIGRSIKRMTLDN